MRFLPNGILPEQVVARIGLISDTHMPQRLAALPLAIFDVLDGVDLLLHAGDVGELWVLDLLSTIAPVLAVHGNDDTDDAQRELPYQHLVTVAGQRILLCHSHHPDRAEELASRRVDDWGPKLERWSAMGIRAGAGIVVFGHTHIPMALRHNGVLLANPGAIASGNATTCQRRQSVALLFVCKDGTSAVAHIDLATPEQVFQPRLDWDAGFLAALDQYSESILAPDLADVWDRLYEFIRPLGPEPYYSALLRVSHRVWAGEQAAITQADLLGELEAGTEIPIEVQAQIRSIMNGYRHDLA